MKLPQRVGLIWAQSFNGVIGVGNKIPKEFLSDLAYFKKITINHTVIMGRKTWESLPVKPLPNRINVVLTSDVNYQVPEGVKVIQSLDDLEVETEALFFIGGTKVYELGYPYANELYITVNNAVINGDAFAPNFYADVLNEANGWKLVEKNDLNTTHLEQPYIQIQYFLKKFTGESNEQVDRSNEKGHHDHGQGRGSSERRPEGNQASGKSYGHIQIQSIDSGKGPCKAGCKNNCKGKSSGV